MRAVFAAAAGLIVLPRAALAGLAATVVSATPAGAFLALARAFAFAVGAVFAAAFAAVFAAVFAGAFAVRPPLAFPDLASSSARRAAPPDACPSDVRRARAAPCRRVPRACP